MWTGNYNSAALVALLGVTLAGSMWTGNYNNLHGRPIRQ